MKLLYFLQMLFTASCHVESSDVSEVADITTGLGWMTLAPGLSWTSGKVALCFRATGSTDLSQHGEGLGSGRWEGSLVGP